MSLRAVYWTTGVFAVLVAALAIDGGPEARGFGVLAMVLALGIIGLIGEFVSLRRTRAVGAAARSANDLRLADGQVGIARVDGVQVEPNRRDPRFRRFVAIEPGDTKPVAHELSARRLPPLLGRVVLFSLFQGRDGLSWSNEEIARAHDSLWKAGAWIEREAIRWHAPVNIELADTYFVSNDDEPDDVAISFIPQGDEQGPLEVNAVTKALTGASRAAARLGFRDAAELCARINSRVEADARVWLIHPRRAGRSLAVPLDETQLAGVSLAVCYARESSFPEPLAKLPYTDPVTVVHELLHLFGATDKYGLPLRSFPPRSVTSREVMLLNESSLPRLRIDPRTATEIGWVTEAWA
jgi:hypothetical protein